MNDQRTNNNNCAIPVPSFVYFARVGRMIKIGYSANVAVRMYYLRCQTGQDHEAIFQIPGGFQTERKLHRLFHSEHVAGELFRPERVEQFIARARVDLKDAWNWLDAGAQGAADIRALRKRVAELNAAHGIHFYCPYGHSQHFTIGESPEEKLRRERDRLAQQIAEKDDEINRQRDMREETERRLSATRGVVTRIKNRVGHGVCPCCNRSFGNLANHMMKQHPHFVAEAAE